MGFFVFFYRLLVGGKFTSGSTAVSTGEKSREITYKQLHSGIASWRKIPCDSCRSTAVGRNYSTVLSTVVRVLYRGYEHTIPCLEYCFLLSTCNGSHQHVTRLPCPCFLLSRRGGFIPRGNIPLTVTNATTIDNMLDSQRQSGAHTS